MAWREYYYDWAWELDGTPEQLWPYVSDTNRFNADVGLGHLTINEKLPESLGRRLRFYQFGLVPIEWVEEPFDWVYAKSFGVLRRYTLGPVAEMRVFTTLTPLEGNRTKLRYEVWARPRNVLGWVSIPIIIGVKSHHDFGRVFNMYSTWIKNGVVPIDNLTKQMRFAARGKERLDRIQERLLNQGVSSQLLDRLVQLVTRGDEFDVSELRPYALADQWQVERRDVLEMFLYGTKAGLLDMEWQLLCPQCRGANDNVTDTLGELSNENVHCPSCLIDYEINFEHGVELVFRPNPAVRPLETMNFCVGGPQITPHIVAQQVLQPSETRELVMSLDLGRYRIRRLNHSEIFYFRVEQNGADFVDLDRNVLAWAGDERILAPFASFTFENGAAQSKQFVIERTEWSDTAVTAAEIIANQAFRDLFSEQALRPDAQFSVGQTTILFTDLVGSTQMYNDIGDASAFGLVLGHFDILKESIAEQDGAIVKTIGDAVMAGFRTPVAALEAIINAQTRLHADGGDRPLLLKASIHTGPCIAVTLNERLDYFGSTVNIAARLEGFASTNVTVISDEVYQDPGVQSFIRERAADVAVKGFEGMLKGYGSRPFQLWRIFNQDIPLPEAEKEESGGKVQEIPRP